MKMIESGKRHLVPIEQLGDLFESVKRYHMALGVNPDAIVASRAQHAAWGALEGPAATRWITYAADGEKMRMHVFGLPVYVVDANNFASVLV